MKKLFFYAAIFIILFYIYDQVKSEQGSSNNIISQPLPKTASEIFNENLKLETTWKLGGFGTVFMLSGSIENRNPTRASDVIVRCTTYGQTDSVLSRVSHTFRVHIEPNQTYSFSEVNMGIVDSESRRAFCRTLTL